MAYKIYAPLVLVLLGNHTTAAVLTASTATITPAPLKARDITTVGYISTGTSGGTTLWDTITVNSEDQVIATSSDLFQICNPGQLCEFFSCSNDYVVYPSSSIYCGMSNETCSYYLLATDVYDQAPLTNYWCDSITETGGIIYEVTPDGSEGFASSPETTTKPSTGPVSEPSDPPSDSSSSSRTHSKPKKSTPVGAIAGGVIGGLAVLGAIIFGVFFCLRRKRNKAQAQPQTHAHPQARPPQQPLPTQYYGHGQKPVGVSQVQQMPPQQQYYDPNTQQAPQFYDPNTQPAYGQQASQGRYAMPEKTPAATNNMQPYYANNGGVSGPASPVPMYTPPAMSPANVPANTAPPANVNELPSPVPVYTPPLMSPANGPVNTAPPANVNELPTQRM